MTNGYEVKPTREVKQLRQAAPPPPCQHGLAQQGASTTLNIAAQPQAAIGVHDVPIDGGLEHHPGLGVDAGDPGDIDVRPLAREIPVATAHAKAVGEAIPGTTREEGIVLDAEERRLRVLKFLCGYI